MLQSTSSVGSQSTVRSQPTQNLPGFRGTISGVRQNVLTKIGELQASEKTKLVQKTFSTYRDPITCAVTLTAAAILTSDANESTRATGASALVGFCVTALLAAINEPSVQDESSVDTTPVAQTPQPTVMPGNGNTSGPTNQTFLTKMMAESKLIARHSAISAVLGRFLLSDDFRGAAIGAFTGMAATYASVAFNEGKVCVSLNELKNEEKHYPELMTSLVLIASVLGYTANDPKILIAIAVGIAGLALPLAASSCQQALDNRIQSRVDTSRTAEVTGINEV